MIDATTPPRELKGTRPFLLAPSVLSADPLAIGTSIDNLEGEADWIHVDIMDGHFVPNLTYGPALVKALRRRYPDAFLDVHIMAERADDFLDMFAESGASLLTVHVEATRHIHRVLQTIRKRGIRPGVTLNPGTPIQAIEPILNMVDLVLVMSVNPGFAAQKFIPEVLAKVKELVRYRTAHGLDFLIEIDGGVDANNARMLVTSGCDVLVAGNAIFGSENPAEMARKIKNAVSAQPQTFAQREL